MPPRSAYLLAAGLLAAVALAGCGGDQKRTATTSSPTPQTTSAPTTTTTTTPGVTTRAKVHRSRAPRRVGEIILHLVDHSRTIALPDGRRIARPLTTIVRYPSGASRGRAPLVVFGHGFTVSPAPYARLLQAWAAAGYVVAAPIFPLENGSAPGGPNENDLVNQPADMSFVITQLLDRSAGGRGPLPDLIDPGAIAVAGQSDGGETALATAYDGRFRDPRVIAAMILSGAEIPGIGGFRFPASSPPLLATQGTADTVNPPSFTQGFFNLAPRPKYLLRLLGAGHLPPYDDEQPQLGIVERVTTAFLDAYLRHRAGAARAIRSAGEVPGVAELIAYP